MRDASCGRKGAHQRSSYFVDGTRVNNRRAVAGSLLIACSGSSKVYRGVRKNKMERKVRATEVYLRFWCCSLAVSQA